LVDAPEKSNNGLPDSVEVCPQGHEYLSGDTFSLANQSQEYVLGSDAVMTQFHGFPKRQFEDLVDPGRERRRLRWGGARWLNSVAHGLANGLQRDTYLGEGLGSNAVPLMEEAEQEVLGADETVVEITRLFLSQHQDPTSTVIEPLEHGHQPFTMASSVAMTF
jgi:hypothetical protein